MSAPYRDAQTEQAIADARARPLRDDPDEADLARNAEGPFDDRPDVPEPTAAQASTVLTGESHEAFAEFTAAAQALEAHQRAATPVLERYKTALAKLSGIAARSGG